jgi:hypothetical protein
MSKETINIVAGAFLGAILSILTTIVIEATRRPRLRLKITPPTDIVYPSEAKKQANSMRSVRLIVSNEPLPALLRWLSRETAIQCHAEIRFRNLDTGANVFQDKMIGRWTNSPEPVRSYLLVEEAKALPIIDLALDTRRDIPAGREELLDVVTRYDDEEPSYGWNNEIYFTEWRNPRWKLPPARYLVDVTIVSAGARHTQTFRLLNDVPKSELCLSLTKTTDPASPD